MRFFSHITLSELKNRALDLYPENKIFFSRIKKKKHKSLDSIVHELHHAVFQEMDCLDCANCCKTISPTINYKDIDRLARHLKIKPSRVVEQYLFIDQEGDYVFRQTPCPFLLPDNYCLVYESRPKACREYPHTDRPRFYQLLKLTLKNSQICPAVYEIIERLKKLKDKF
ncbi:MAG: YkgJ family cysteine cluster protein [Bacteroidales bacterium]|jgi:Fe-S-cluster containining protein|nr:YkgJ family cysteine cluster protein [Bacteroidales bacterium]